MSATTGAGPRPVRAPRGRRDQLQGMAAGGRAPHADEQPRSRGRRAAGRPRRVRRHRHARRAAGRRSTRSSHALRALEHDETLLVQSGKPVAVFRTHRSAPRVLIANSNLVGRWATWEHFRELERRGLMMYGQMTAGSWIYIGSQGIVQGTYETFGAVARRHFGGTLAGRLVVTAGLGGMGGAQPLAATMQGAAMLAFDVDESRIDKRLATGYCDVKAPSLDEALAAGRGRARPRDARCRSPCDERGAGARGARDARRARRRAHRPDERARHARRLRARRHDARRGGGAAVEPTRRRTSPRARRPRRGTCGRCSRCSERGAVTFDYGNNIRTVAFDAGVADAFDIPGFMPEYIRPLFCEGKGPFRWVALSGDPADIRRTDELVLELFPDDEHLRRWITLARERIHFQGLPARICWLGQGDARAIRRRAQRPRRARRAVGADRDRPRPPRHRQRRVAVPRDRGDAGRQRRGRRLADPQRAAQRRERRVLGVVPSRRRRRHRQLAARRARSSSPTAPTRCACASSAC